MVSTGPTFTVCLMYYILYTINPDLVKNLQAFIPAKLEFILHLAILPVAVLESIVGDHEIKVGETMKMARLRTNLQLLQISKEKHYSKQIQSLKI